MPPELKAAHRAKHELEVGYIGGDFLADFKHSAGTGLQREEFKRRRSVQAVLQPRGAAAPPGRSQLPAHARQRSASLLHVRRVASPIAVPTNKAPAREGHPADDTGRAYRRRHKQHQEGEDRQWRCQSHGSGGGRHMQRQGGRLRSAGCGLPASVRNLYGGCSRDLNAHGDCMRMQVASTFWRYWEARACKSLCASSIARLRVVSERGKTALRAAVGLFSQLPSHDPDSFRRRPTAPRTAGTTAQQTLIGLGHACPSGDRR